MMPVILLSDGYLANGAEPWRLPDARRPARDPGDVPHRSRGLPALPARSRRRWRGRGRARHAGPRAPHRRPREAGRHRQRQLRRRSTTSTMVQLRAEKVAGIVAGHPGRRCRPAIPTATCWSSAGARPTARSPRRCARSARAGPARRPRAPAPPQPAAANLGEVLKRFKQRAGARAEPGPARAGCCARSTWSTPSAYTRSRASRSSRPRSRRRSTSRCWRDERGRHDRDAAAALHEEGLRRPTRKSAGAPAAATTRSSPRCSRCSPSSASRARTSWSSRASAARAASRTT